MVTHKLRTTSRHSTCGRGLDEMLADGEGVGVYPTCLWCATDHPYTGVMFNTGPSFCHDEALRKLVP